VTASLENVSVWDVKKATVVSTTAPHPIRAGPARMQCSPLIATPCPAHSCAPWSPPSPSRARSRGR
jgi:hypothetical protein